MYLYAVSGSKPYRHAIAAYCITLGLLKSELLNKPQEPLCGLGC